MTTKKTYPRILLLIFSSSIFFIFLYFALYYYTKQVEKQVYKNSIEQFDNEVNKLLVLDSKPIKVAINNDTNWDEFVNFIKTKDKHWYDETIGNEVDIYKADYLGAYDINKKFIIRTPTSKIKSIDFIPKQAMTQLDKSGLTRFYMKIPEGVIEVIGASIHPSNDPLKNKTKASGYFFVVRLLDTTFLKDLEKLTSSKIKFVKNSEENPIGRNQIFSTIDLRDSQNNIVTKLNFSRKFDVYFENLMDVLYIIIFAFVVNLIINLLYTKKWVFHPLDLITEILETGNKKTIKELKSTTGEFRNIGNLFEENNNQKKELLKAKLKAEENDKLKSIFLANLSHEIRTPMNAIVGFSDLIYNSNFDEAERTEYLKIIKKSGKNLLTIIEDLIEMSKIDAQQITSKYVSFDLEKCISELYTTLKITIPKEKKIDFKIIKPIYPVKNNILSDEIKLRQVITNLISNAIKYTDEGFIEFGYNVNEKEKKIEFFVADSGIGIDNKNLSAIFDRFQRIENDFSIKLSGLGLGLSISKAYVEILGGKINVKSEIGRGSIFSFAIPLKEDKTEQIINTKSKINEFKKSASKIILIAEDNSINFLLLKKILELKNYTVLKAINGKEAVDVCRNNQDIDLVFMDIKMPIMDGIEAFKIINSFNPNLPIIAQTAYSSIEDKSKIMQLGFAGYVSKPLDKEKIYELIDKIFQENQIGDNV